MRNPAQEDRRRDWKFRADFFHDVTLPPATWTIDGVAQDGPPTEEALLAVPVRATDKSVVTCSAPLHVDIANVIGFLPPYRGLKACP